MTGNDTLVHEISKCAFEKGQFVSAVCVEDFYLDFAEDLARFRITVLNSSLFLVHVFMEIGDQGIPRRSACPAGRSGQLSQMTYSDRVRLCLYRRTDKQRHYYQ